jgi:hypothetical protein
MILIAETCDNTLNVAGRTSTCAEACRYPLQGSCTNFLLILGVAARQDCHLVRLELVCDATVSKAVGASWCKRNPSHVVNFYVPLPIRRSSSDTISAGLGNAARDSSSA